MHCTGMIGTDVLERFGNAGTRRRHDFTLSTLAELFVDYNVACSGVGSL